MRLTTSAAIAALASVANAYTWKNVHTGGGGGFTPGIVFSTKQKGVAFARTDIGGLYRLNSDDTWTPLTDFANDTTWHDWGIDAVATDPTNANIVYAAVGMYTNSWDPNNGAIIRSTDQGNTWTSYPLSFKVGGNMPGRGMGERLAIDPNANNILFFGARSGNGLWKSTNSGQTWTKVSSFPDTGPYVPDPTDSTGYNSDKQGFSWITFDTNSTKVNGATGRIFAAVADNTHSSVYVSNDAGSTWSAVANQPIGFLPHKGKIAPAEHALYVSYSNGSGPYDGGNGSVYRYDITASLWKDISPVPESTTYFGYGGLTIDPQRPGTVMVASLNSWYPDAVLFRSNNSGQSWSRIWDWTSYPNENFYYSMDNTLAPWVPNVHDINTKTIGWMIESLEIDPFDSNHWLYGTGLSVYGGHDLLNWDSKHNVSIKVLASGIEETSVQALTITPGGSLISCMGDIGGFVHKSLTTAPAAELPLFTTSVDIDYAGKSTSALVRIGNGNDGSIQIAMSRDGGGTWYLVYGESGAPTGGKVALNAQADTIVWSAATGGVLRSQNSGSFAAVASLPTGAAVTSDKVNNTVFYGGSGGTFYVSTDTGATFVSKGKLGSSSVVNEIAVNPTVAGDVWATTDLGLFHSTNYGSTFAQVPGPTQGWAFAFGKSTANTYGYNIYGFFRINGVNTIYKSTDVGKTWAAISDASHGFGSASSNPVTASLDQEGLVFVGTNGRGVFYGTP